MLDERRWNELFGRLSGSPPPRSFSLVAAAYCEPHRRYHTSAHITHCLAELDSARPLLQSPDEVEVAIWLHDVVYDPHAPDNEEKSAQFAAGLLREAGCPQPRVRRITELILLTRHQLHPADPDALAFLDIDLSILGQPPETYDLYEKDIRTEYGWVPADEYRARRGMVLRRFLEREFIYGTERFRNLYERQARENLSRAFAALVSPRGEA